MLYRYASLDYLKDIQRVITQLINGPLTPELEKVLAASYAYAMRGQRPLYDDPQLWRRNSRSVLEQMQALLAKDIARRAGGRYISGGLDHFFLQVARSDAYESTLRMMDEYQVYSDLIGNYISPTDRILVEHRRQFSVDDYWFAYHYADFLSDRARIPKFRVRTDICAETGASPPRAGVYVCQDDPNSAPQFAWPDKEGGKLTECCTFSDVALAAHAAVGREGLWFDQNKMHEFVCSDRYRPFFDNSTLTSPGLAPGAVARLATVRRPAQWYFVEIEQEDFEDSALEYHRALASQPEQGRLAAGDICKIEGSYFAVTRVGSDQYLRVGDVAPDLELRHNRTFWQLRIAPPVKVTVPPAPIGRSKPLLPSLWEWLRRRQTQQ
jgi:hypothetical protein